MRTITLTAAGLTLATGLMAQQFEEVEPDPNQRVKEGFDMGRAIFWESPNFIPLRNPEWQPLRAARRSGAVADDAPVVFFEIGGRTLAFVSSQIAYHHVAQGEIDGEPWMVTF